MVGLGLLRTRGLARLEAWAAPAGLPMETEEERLDTMRAAAEHELQLMIRRVKRELDKLGLRCGTWPSPPTMDGDTGETVRVHHHLVVDQAVRGVFVESGRAWAAWTGTSFHRPHLQALIGKGYRTIPTTSRHNSAWRKPKPPCCPQSLLSCPPLPLHRRHGEQL